MPPTEDFIDRQDALDMLAVMGDLSMGQPTDHSQRVAGLSTALARQLGWEDEAVEQVRLVALLRWSGCTANASEIATTMSDDVSGRAAMLALQYDKIELLVPMQNVAAHAQLVSSIHCEVSSLVAESLGLDGAVRAALGCVFEHWDGSGQPKGLMRDAIPAAAMVVCACSELEVLSRVHELAPALQLMRHRSSVVYPAHQVDCIVEHADSWLHRVAMALSVGQNPTNPGISPPVAMDLIGHAIDLKLPWLLGHSRAVVDCADAMAQQLRLPPGRRSTLRQAAWLHGLGRVAIANRVWNLPGILTAACWEQVRLAPYWTSRAARRIERLQAAADLASHAFERLDGSGYFRGMAAQSTPMDSRILAAAVAWVALRADRPWRAAVSADAALAALHADGDGRRFDAEVLEALRAWVWPQAAPHKPKRDAGSVLTAREREVLRRISLGDSNKEAAKRLGISPSTVRTHLESVFKKLDCKTRAAVTLRASMQGLLDG